MRKCAGGNEERQQQGRTGQAAKAKQQPAGDDCTHNTALAQRLSLIPKITNNCCEEKTKGKLPDQSLITKTYRIVTTLTVFVIYSNPIAAIQSNTWMPSELAHTKYAVGRSPLRVA